MKILRLIILIYFFSLPLTSSCQNWQGLGGGINGIRCMFTDITNNMLYIGGSYNPSYPLSGFLGWNGTNWDTLINKNPWGNIDPILCVNKFNEEIYIGGFVYLKKWNGSSWIVIENNPNGLISNLCVINNELYVGGIFDSICGIAANCIAKWDGNTWTSLNFPLSNSPSIGSICEYKGELYVGGNFYSSAYPNDTIQNIIRFDGYNWKSVGGGLHGGMDEIGSMVIYKNELYVSGSFTKAHGNVGNYIQKWDGENWSDVGGGVMGYGGIGNGQIRQLIVYNDKLYAVGVFQYAGGVPAQYIALWDGAKWCGLGSTFSNILNSLGVYNNMLYVGGGFGVIDGLAISHIAKWTGGSYVDTCGNATGITEMMVKNNNVVIYPNPSNGNSINIKFPFVKSGDYEVLDVLGAVVAKGKITNTDIIEINLNTLSNGCYFVKVKGKDKFYVGRFVKN